ncbi:MAG: hypothetical protein LBQ66_04965 [Planctomycetaceae bacterium]|nr:hypothetical protein [Planctomycetaceae bacterium]
MGAEHAPAKQTRPNYRRSRQLPRGGADWNAGVPPATVGCRTKRGCKGRPVVSENICRHVLVCRFNFFGSIVHRGGRDARVPVRAASRKFFSLPRSGELM